MIDMASGQYLSTHGREAVVNTQDFQNPSSTIPFSPVLSNHGREDALLSPTHLKYSIPSSVKFRLTEVTTAYVAPALGCSTRDQ
jgi:hypothetical protein